MILRGTIFSQQLQMATNLTILAPEHQSAAQPLAICYLLHGLCGNQADLVDYTLLPRYAEGYHCLFVLPEVGRSFYTDMRNGQNYFSYITEELPQICRQLFQVSTQPEQSSLIGISMGGYGALKAALSYPERYGACYAISPGCLFLKDFLAEMRQRQLQPEFIARWGAQFISDFRAAFGEDFHWSEQIELLELAAQAASAPRLPRLHSVCGTEDSLLELNRAFAQQAQALLRGYRYQEWPGQHDWAFFNQALEQALAFCCGSGPAL